MLGRLIHPVITSPCSCFWCYTCLEGASGDVKWSICPRASTLPPSFHPSLTPAFIYPGGTRINGDKEVEKVAWVVATKGDIVPLGRGRKVPRSREHFDAVWMKDGRGEGREEGEQTGGGDDTKTQKATKPLPAGTQDRTVPLFRWIELGTMRRGREPPCPCSPPTLSSLPCFPPSSASYFTPFFPFSFFERGPRLIQLCSVAS